MNRMGPGGRGGGGRFGCQVLPDIWSSIEREDTTADNRKTDIYIRAFETCGAVCVSIHRFIV